MHLIILPIIACKIPWKQRLKGKLRFKVSISNKHPWSDRRGSIEQMKKMDCSSDLTEPILTWMGRLDYALPCHSASPSLWNVQAFLCPQSWADSGRVWPSAKRCSVAEPDPEGPKGGRLPADRTITGARQSASLKAMKLVLCLPS